MSKLPAAAHPLAELLMLEHDGLLELRKRAQKEMLAEAHKHRAWIRAPIQQTRGLNRNSNRTLKGIFKAAATTVIGQAKDEPLYRHYQRLLDGGTKPNLAKLTLVRQIASIMLAVWRNEEVYDPERVGQAR